MVEDILEPCDWWLRDLWRIGVKVGGILCDSGADVISIRVEESKEPVWFYSDLCGCAVVILLFFWVALFCELM